MKRIKELYIVFNYWDNEYLFINELYNLFFSKYYRQKIYEDMFWYRASETQGNISSCLILRESFDSFEKNNIFKILK